MKTHEDYLAIAQSLQPQLREAARRAELNRQPDDGVINAAKAAGLFEMMSPRCYGGDELDLDTFFEVGMILAEGDASHAWVMSFYIEHVWMFCQFPEEFQAKLFADRSYVLAPAMLSPTGKAEAIDGGFMLSGRWQWGTGIVHADWVLAGAMVPRGERIEAMFFALPRQDVQLDDTWHMDGMCGTGSHDVVIDTMFVPIERTVSIREMVSATAPGGRLHGGALYATPMAPILSLTAAMPVLGQAKAAVKEFATQLTGRYDLATLAAQSHRSSRQSRLAEAELTVAAAEALTRSVLAEVMAKRGSADETTRVGWTASFAHVVSMCQDAVHLLCEAAGASAHALDNPLQRTRRDINTMACHMVFDRDERNRCFGRVLLGLPSESIWH